ncbi:MAG: hypothetical protein ABI620_01420 [Chloroflexota bacterium]
MNARKTARPLAALATLAIILAACGGGAASTAPATQAATLAPATTPLATQPATTGGPSLDPLASFHGAQDLEALLPDDIAGVPMIKASISGEDYMSSLGGNEELANALTALNKTPADLKVAFGSAGTGTIFAFQVNGVPGAQILSALFAAQTEGSTVTDITLGGKAVKKVIASGETTPSYIYATQDVVFVALAGITDAQLDAMFAALP